MASPLSESERARILELHGQGMSRNAITKEVGRSSYAVSRTVADAGLTFARAGQVEAATKAKTVDNAAKRARLQADLLDDAIRLREQLWEPCHVYSFGGRDNTYAEHELDKPDFAGQHTILRAVGVAVDKSVRLAEVDKATTGADEGRSIVGAFFDALRGHQETNETPGPEAEGSQG